MQIGHCTHGPIGLRNRASSFHIQGTACRVVTHEYRKAHRTMCLRLYAHHQRHHRITCGVSFDGCSNAYSLEWDY